MIYRFFCCIAINKILKGRGVFYNDPDFFILRDSNNQLTKDKKYMLFQINSVLGGFVFTSDNINEYTDRCGIAYFWN